MFRILLIIALCCAAGLITLWAVKTGGSVSFHGKGWDFQISLWAFITSFLSGAGLLWIGAALLVWIIRSPLMVFSWFRNRKAKDKTVDFLTDMEFLNCNLIAPVKKHMPYKNVLIQSYINFKISLLEKKWDQAEALLKKLEPHTLLLTWGYMALEKARGDEAMALRYGLDVYRQGGPVAFIDLLKSAEQSNRVHILLPYLEEAYKQSPSWQVFRHLVPVWEHEGHKRKLLSNLKKLWQTEQGLDIFNEICRFENANQPIERAHIFKKLQFDIPVTDQGYDTMHQVFLEAGLWGEAEEAKKHVAISSSSY